MPRCEEPIEDLVVSCQTDEAGGGTKQNPDWEVMNGTELYVRTNEMNVTMQFNVSSGMPISFNVSNNDTIETEIKRELGSGNNDIIMLLGSFYYHFLR